MNAQVMRKFKRVMQEMRASNNKTFKFKKGDRVVIRWEHPDTKIMWYYLATVDMVRSGMVYCTWDNDGTKTKLAPNDENWVGYGVKKKVKRDFSEKDVHFYVTEWMNKPKSVKGEIGEKRIRVSKKKNDDNIIKLDTLHPDGTEESKEIDLLNAESEEIAELIDALDPVTTSKKNIESIDDRIARIAKTIEDLDETPIEISRADRIANTLYELGEEEESKPRKVSKKEEPEEEYAPEVIEKKGRKLPNKKLAKTRIKNKHISGSVESLEVGKAYQMIGSAKELGDFYHDPFFKIIGANKKKNDTLYLIQHNTGKGKILGSSLPSTTEIRSMKKVYWNAGFPKFWKKKVKRLEQTDKTPLKSDIDRARKNLIVEMGFCIDKAREEFPELLEKDISYSYEIGNEDFTISVKKD